MKTIKVKRQIGIKLMNMQTDKNKLRGIDEICAAKVIKDKFFPEEDLTVEIIASDLHYYAWPQTFGSTAGPFKGIGGQAISTFTIEAYEFAGKALYFCQGKQLKCCDFNPFTYTN